MDDLISRQAAIGAVNTALFPKINTARDAEKALKQLPSVQPEPIKINIDHELTKDEYEKLLKDMADAPIVLLPSVQPEVIHCRDCKWHNGEINQCSVQICASMRCEDFCSRAERRTDDER